MTLSSRDRTRPAAGPVGTTRTGTPKLATGTICNAAGSARTPVTLSKPVRSRIGEHNRRHRVGNPSRCDTRRRGSRLPRRCPGDAYDNGPDGIRDRPDHAARDTRLPEPLLRMSAEALGERCRRTEPMGGDREGLLVEEREQLDPTGLDDWLGVKRDIDATGARCSELGP